LAIDDRQLWWHQLPAGSATKRWQGATAQAWQQQQQPVDAGTAQVKRKLCPNNPSFAEVHATTAVPPQHDAGKTMEGLQSVHACCTHSRLQQLSRLLL
jgi:hypothetical protein